MASVLMVYFENAAGKVSLPPSVDTPTPDGYARRECHDIFEVERVEKRLQQETMDRREQEAQTDYNTFEEGRRATRRKIMTLIESSHTDARLRDFLIGWCQLRDEKRREYYKQQINCYQSGLEMLNYDKPRNAEELLKESL
jgi:hypothetical protein